MMQDDCSFFRCLNCGSSSVDVSLTSWTCRQCVFSYPVQDGVPLLVRDWHQHAERLAQARAANPGWYVDEQPTEVASPWRHHLRKRRSYVESAIVRYLREVGRSRARTLLDLGCGDANNLEFLRPYAETLFGSDYNSVRLIRARARDAPATLFLADVLDYPARDNFFEVVFFNHVIEHIPDDERALDSVSRILQPNGLLVLGTPNEGAWWWQLAYKLQPDALRTTDHVHFYTADSIATKLKRHGFRVFEVEHLGWGPPHWGLDGRLRKYKILDDWFDRLGRVLVPRQASSLYVLATK